jgi:hypothetical protein
MTRRFVYIIVIIIFLGLVTYVIWYWQNKHQGSPRALEQNVLPLAASNDVSKNIPTGDTITIGTPRGSVQVKNFYKDIEDTEEGLVILRDSDEYEVVYNPAASEFSIYIKQPPLETERAKAEADLLNLLGLNADKIKACYLKVSLYISPLINENLSGNDLGLSFCKSGIQSSQ